MKLRLLLFSLILPFLSDAQPLAFDAANTGAYPSVCRLYAFQNGGGIVYAAATGGTPPYTFQWTNTFTSQTSNNSTWAGLNPSLYEIKIWDAVNDSISMNVFLDSLNPHADYHITGPSISAITAGYIGFAPVNATFVNDSYYYNSPTISSGDTSFFWQFQSGGNWQLVDSYSPQNHYYSSGGTYQTTLVAINQNGCTDTVSKQLGLFDLTDTDELSNGFFTLESPQPQSILFQKTNHFEPVLFKLFDLSGKIILEKEIINQTEYIAHSQKTGIYLYQLIDKSNSKSISGKIRLK